jgi:hypothetical protein
MAGLRDKRLEGNIMYQKMLARLEAFFFVAEKYRKHGPTPKQAQMMRDTGYPFSYHIELHKCLK